MALKSSEGGEIGKIGAPVSIVVPVYNEQDAIVATVEAIDRVMAGMKLDYEIIVVNDGSNDGTSQHLKTLKARLQRLITIDHDVNLGYGAALKTGIARSAYERVLIIDADQTYPVEDIPRLLKRGQEFDLVVGSRLGQEVRIPFCRKPAKWVMKRLAEFLSNRHIPDLNSGFRLFKKEIVLNWLPMFPDGFSFTSTLTIIAIHNGYSVDYLPINYFKREGKSKIRPVRDTVTFLQLILRTILYVNPLRIFIPASLAFFVISVLLFSVRVASGGGYLVTIILTFICGFELLVVGMLADLIDKRLR